MWRLSFRFSDGTGRLSRAEIAAGARVPKALAASGHTAQVIREPYGVTLIIGPFNGPLILLLDPAITALSAGNPCILKLAESIPATSTLLQNLVPKYFEPHSVTAVSGSREEVTELLKLPLDFIFSPAA
jgi:aldehyde dehydrogenase (NAD+)